MITQWKNKVNITVINDKIFSLIQFIQETATSTFNCKDYYLAKFKTKLYICKNKHQLAIKIIYDEELG